jgi:hypothetical protein
MSDTQADLERALALRAMQERCLQVAAAASSLSDRLAELDLDADQARRVEGRLSFMLDELRLIREALGTR